MMRRFVEIIGKPEHAPEFAAAVTQWLAAEKFAKGVSPLINAGRIVVELMPLQEIRDGQLYQVDDRPRAVAVLKKYIRPHLVESVVVEGRDWNG